MTFVITTRQGDGKPVVMNLPDLAEGDARSMCRSLAENGMSKVTLHSLSDEGIIEAMSAWSAGGKRARTLSGTTPKAEQVGPSFGRAGRAKAAAKETTEVVDDAADEQDNPDLHMPAPDPADAIEIPEDADSGETYNGYCVKCKAKRDFHGEVKISESGRRMAQGLCPVCGTKMNRILGKAEHPDDWHDEHSNAEETKSVTVTVEDGEAEVSVEGEQHIEDVAEAVEEAAEAAVASPQFSDEDRKAIKATATVINKSAKELLTEKAKPAAKKAQPKKVAPAKKAAAAAATATKRTNKKATPSEDISGIPKEVEGMQKVATCPKCGRKQPVQDKAGLTVLMTHSAPGLDSCPGGGMVLG